MTDFVKCSRFCNSSHAQLENLFVEKTIVISDELYFKENFSVCAASAHLLVNKWVVNNTFKVIGEVKKISIYEKSKFSF